MTDESTLELVPVGIIDHHRANPRQDIGDVSDLAASVRSVGVLQPIAVHRKGRRFVCLMGNRRLAAAKEAGLEVVPAMVWTGLSDAEQVVVMMVENLQRSDLNPIDEAEGYRALGSAGLDQEKIGAKVGRSQSHISRRLRLLELDDETKAKVRAGKLSASAALRTLEPKKERPAKAETVEEAEQTSGQLTPDLQAIYGDATPGVVVVRSEVVLATSAIDRGDLPSAAAHIVNAHRLLFPVTDRQDGPDVGPVVSPLAEKIDAAAEATPGVHGPESVPDVDEPGAFEPADTLASIHQLRSNADPVSQMAAGIAETVAEGNGEAGGVTVTIGAPEGIFKTHEVMCSTCGRLTRASDLAFGEAKARTHLDRVHAGSGTVDILSAAAAES